MGTFLCSVGFHKWAVATVPATAYFWPDFFKMMMTFVSFYAAVSGHWSSYQAALAQQEVKDSQT